MIVFCCTKKILSNSVTQWLYFIWLWLLVHMKTMISPAIVFSFFQNTDFQVFQSSSINDDDELFCGMVDQRKVFSLISSRDCCQRSSALQISNLSQRRFEPVQNLSSSLVEWSCAVVIMTTPRCHSAKEILRCAPPSSHVCGFLKKTYNFIFKTTCTFS